MSACRFDQSVWPWQALRSVIWGRSQSETLEKSAPNTPIMNNTLCLRCGAQMEIPPHYFNHEVRCVSCHQSFMAYPLAEASAKWVARDPNQEGPEESLKSPPGQLQNLSRGGVPARSGKNGHRVLTPHQGNLISCPDCGCGVSIEADACPNCGRKIRRRQSAMGIAAAIIIGIAVYWAANLIWGFF